MIRAALVRAVLFTVLWFAFTEGDLSGVFLAIAAIASATTVSLWVSPPEAGRERIRLAALPRFILYFLRRSVAGGMDVARRALHPRLPIAPTIVSYSLSGTGPRATLFFAHVVSLLPGTLSCRLEPELLQVHVLDGRAPVTAELARLQAEVERLYGRG